MRKKSTVLKVVIPLLLVSALLLLPACAGPKAPEGAEVKVEVISDVTGPYSTMLEYYFYGMEDYIKHLNEEGGVDGVKIVAITGDSKADATIASAHYDSAVAQGIIARLGGTTPEILAIRAKLPRDKVPAIGIPASYTFFEEPGWFYSTTGDWAKQFASALDRYFYPEYKKNGGADPMKLALLCWDMSLGRSGPVAIEALMKKQPGRYEIVSQTFPGITTMDYTPDLAQAKAADPDVLLTFVSGAAYGMTLRDAGKVDFPQDIPVVQDHMAFAPGSVELAGAEITRAYGISFMGVPWEGAKVAKLANELCNKYHGKDAPIEYLLGMHTVQTFEAALKMAIKDVGFENVDGAAIKQALDRMEKADIGHGSPISFADHDGDREGPSLIRLLRWDTAKGQPVTVADWFEPFTFPELYG